MAKQPDAELLERFAKLTALLLRINSSLDLDTVLQEVVDSARTLTGARYGIITSVDDAGHVEAFVNSGFTPEQKAQMAAWSGGPQLFQHFRSLRAPLRIADLRSYVRALGLSWDLMLSNTLQVTPMLHRDVDVGTFFLAERDGGHEFSSADEEVLVLLASQAATAIANARVHREERRARADLEALIETSPVAVVVFDGGTGAPTSLNREAQRIVEGLRVPGRSAEELLDLITCRRVDGRAVSLGEFPLAQQFTNGETVRAEEMTLSVPDGRSVTTLVNSTPIRSPDGAVESVVVTLQDLAPLEELERQRAEFLAMVSHELRTPLSSIKGSTAAVLGSSRTPDSAEMLQFFRVVDEQADRMFALIGDLLDQGRIEAGALSISPEPADVAGLIDDAWRMLLGGGCRHALRVDVPDDLPAVMVDRGRIVQVLGNLFSNAARHSPESSPIRVAAERDDVHVAVSVSDEGRGVPPELLPQLFRKHAGAVGGERHGLGSYGLGLVICKGLVEAHGGRIWAESAGAGRGTRFTFTVPVTEESAGAASDTARGHPRGPRTGRDDPRILVVDDDPQTLRHVRGALTEAGYVPIVTGDPEELAGLVRTHKPRLVLLDVLLPGKSGIELMKSVPELDDLPVIFISAYGGDETVARTLDAGAADYIVKPFSPTELTARVRAALRRHAEPAPFLLGELTIHYEQRRVTVGGRLLELTATEFEMLRVLSVNAGRVVTYYSLLRQAWGGRNRGGGDPKQVHAIVRRLRRKLGDDAARPFYVRNVRGVGYRMPGPGDL
ncbi:MAG: ATP-binding protein [Acidobacteria bacterium]|nr:ATP-binding protein [Acidobacteriota bacterium]